MTNLDILFLDNTCPKPYDVDTLDNEPLGGTEASVVRIAEGLSALGYKTGVMQHNRESMSFGRNAFYLPTAEEVSPYVVVTLRGVTEKYPYAKHLSWQHDDPSEKVRGWSTNHVKFLCVSKWHANKLHEFLTGVEITNVYNPVPDGLFLKDPAPYDPTKLVWTASPHKGLKHALEVFKEIKEIIPEMHLHVFNPGYFNTAMINQQGVFIEGPQTCRTAWKHVRESLAVLYPTTFEETFGLIAAEANALMTPLVTYPVAALQETVSGEEQFAKDDSDVVTKIENWHFQGRPKVSGQERFKTSVVLKQWVDLIEGL